MKIQPYTSRDTPDNRRGIRSAKRRRDILRAAGKIFETHGYYGASIRMIARAAHMTPSLLQKYYPAKEDILAAFVDDAVAELDAFVASCRSTIAFTPDTGQLMRMIGTKYMAFLNRRRGFYLTWVTSPELIAPFTPGLPSFIVLQQDTLAKVLAQRLGVAEESARSRVRIYFAALFAWVIYFQRVGIFRPTSVESNATRVARLVDALLSDQNIDAAAFF